jgi:dTDP-4-dehydrorhamnose 3,5-epimerase
MNSAEIFIIGANGQLGTALRTLYPEARFADSDSLDITDSESVSRFDWSGTKVIINAAAYTNVDGAETPEGRVSAWRVNAEAVGNLVQAANSHDMTLVHISSDYVFDGTANLHQETESLSPLGVYGQSKAAGDLLVGLCEKHYLIRTSWVIGEGNNFVRTMQSLAERGISPSVVNDQIGRLTFTSDLAQGINHLITTIPAYGTYNLTGDGDRVSWADIAKIVFTSAGHSESEITGVTTEQYYEGKDGIAPRPLQSTLSLDKIKAAGFVPRDWRESLADYLK